MVGFTRLKSGGLIANMLTEERIREQFNRLVELDKNMPRLFEDMTEIHIILIAFRWVLGEADS